MIDERTKPFCPFDEDMEAWQSTFKHMTAIL